MSAQETKEKILKISLTLFSRRGYDAVSVRDICSRVPIKESTMYYYFRGKREILQVLLRRFEEKAEGLMNRMERELAAPWQPGTGFGDGVTRGFFEEYLMDEFCNSILRLLRMERENDREFEKIYDEWMFERPLHFQQKIFSALAERGLFGQADCAELAVEYYAPVFLYTERWLMCGELTEEKKERFRREAGKQTARFFHDKGVI